MDAESQLLAEKDAEIERLELDLSNALGDSQDKDAEIERYEKSYANMRNDCQLWSKCVDKLLADFSNEIEKRDQLITKLCDALKKSHVLFSGELHDLIDRAREATR